MNIISRRSSKRTKAEAGRVGGQGSGGHNKGKTCKRATGDYNSRAELILAAKIYKAQGMTHTDIGEKIGGVGVSTVSRLLNGDPSTVPKKSYAGEQEERGNIDLLNSLWKVRRAV